jgi:hypothetical protein
MAPLIDLPRRKSNRFKHSAKGVMPMRKLTTSVLLASILVWGAMTAHSVYAQGNQQASGMGHGMMGMMKRSGQMKGHCDNMMSDSHPNDQWKKSTPVEPEKTK